MARKRTFRVNFTNNGKVYEIYCRRISHGEMYGFVEMEELLFGEKSSLLVDPGEEQLKLEFNGVRKTFIPYHSVIRIDEVEKEWAGKILHLANQGAGGSLPSLPLPEKGPAKS